MELRSPSHKLSEQQAKLEEYIACGARLGWLIDPELLGLVLDLRSIW